ncbi:flagellar basal body P-ring formation protein FlgA [bacterium]|nr:flagellar basal body P-ring formation protein FlgA [bacterium]
MRTDILFIVFLSLHSLSWAEPSDSIQSNQSIQNAVTGYLESNLRRQNLDFAIRTHTLDQRLRLKRCGHPLEIFFPHGSRTTGMVSVGVRCSGPVNWTVYTNAEVKIYKQVVVLNKAIAKDALISVGDIELKREEFNGSYQHYITDINAVVGKVARRPLTAGTILTAKKLALQKTVKRGQQVVILARDHGIDIRMTGAALMDGANGQRISVKNSSSKRIIEGTVVSPGIVQVEF